MRLPLTTLLLVLLPRAPLAQPSPPQRGGALAVGIVVGTAAFGAAARGTGEDGALVSFSPYRPTMWGLRLIAGRSAARLAATAAWGAPGLLIRGSGGTSAGLLLVAPGAYHLGAFDATLSVPALRLRGGPVLRPGIGVGLQRWSAPGSAARWIAGAEATTGMEVALTRHLTAELEGHVGLTPASPFRREELPEAFAPRSTWRRSLGLSLLWRW